MMEDVIDALYFAALIPALGFFIFYVRSRWTQYLPGRTSMALTVALLLLISLGLYRQLADEVAPEWVRFFAFLAVVGALWFQFIALLIVQRRKDNTPRRRSTDRVEHERLGDHAERL